MNIRSTSWRRRFTIALAVACTLSGTVSPALAQGQGGAHGSGMHGSGMHGPGMHGSGMHGPGMHGPGMHGPGMHGPGMHGPGPQGAGHEARIAPMAPMAPPAHGFDMHREPSPIHNDVPRFATPHGTVVTPHGTVVTPHAAVITPRSALFTPRGTVVTSVPPQSVLIHHAGIPFSFHNGVWFRPIGSRFVVVAAPIGAFVPFLPPFYTTVWFGGLPYYYAADAYYTWSSDQNAYEVVAPPPGAPEPVVNGDRLYAYPLEGQSPEQQARDRYDCNAWAANETGVDPSQSGDDMDATKSADYNRALSACLTGRGYSVR